MKKVLLHVGSPKTGTTSIQNHLSLEKNLPFNYPDLGECHHNSLSIIYQPYKNWPRVYKSKYSGLSQDELLKIRIRIKESFFSSLSKNENLVLSSESFFNFKKEELLEIQSDLLTNGFTDFLIIVYVREPAKHYLSMMQQGIKASSIIQNPYNYKYDIKTRINIFEDVFSDRIIVRAFVKEILLNESVVDDFVGLCNEFFFVDLKFNLAVNEINKSMSAEELIILQKYRREVYPDKNNYFKKDSNLIQVKLKELIERESLKLTVPCLKSKVSNIVNENHVVDLSFLKENYGIDFLLTNDSVSDECFIFNELDLSCILKEVDHRMVDYVVYSLLKDFLCER